MANFKIGRGMQYGIPETLTDGMLYYCTDTTNLFIDYTDSNGNLIRSQLSANYADKLRYVADGATVEIDPKDIALDSEVLHKNQPEQTNDTIAFIRPDDTIESPKRTYVNPHGVHAISSINITNEGTDSEGWMYKGLAIEKRGIVSRRVSCPKGDYSSGVSINQTIISSDSDDSNIIFGFGGNIALYSGSKEEGSSGTLVYTMKEDNDLELANKQYVDTNIADAVKYSEQTLTEVQQAQARTNIGAISQDELPAADQSTFGAVKVENVVTNAVCGSGQYNSIYINEAGVIVSAKSVKYFDTMDQVSNQNTVNGNIAVVRSKGTSTIDVVYPAIVFSTTTQSHGWFDGWLIDAEGNYYTCNIKSTGVEAYTSQRKYGLPTPTADDNNKVLSVSEGAPIWTDVSIPSKTSDLTNDSGFLTAIPDEYVTDDELTAKGYLTSYTETDPTVPAWAKEANKPTYTAAEVGALPADTVIPSIDGLATESYVDTEVATKITTPTTATVGQILRVKAIDTNGVPTEWETVDYNSVTEDRVNELITAALATTQSYYTGTADPEDSLGSDGDIYLKTT